MAVTRIWAVKDNLSRVLDYASNKNKTDLSKYADLIDTLHYAADEEKINLENEQKLLVEGINCDPDIAVQQMIDTKEIYGKTDDVLAYHAYISFKPGEVSPEEAQQVAMEVANKMWGEDYELIVATHLNANCVHCHIVINSVSITDGRKMNENEAMYYEFRRTSDAVCREHGLSVIEKPKGKRVPYNIYMAQKKGIKTKYDYMCEDLDYAIEKSHNEQIFFKIMSSKGYWFKDEAIGFKTDKYPVKLSNLGEDYTYQKIRERIYSQDKFVADRNYRNYLYTNKQLRYTTFVYEYKGVVFKESDFNYRFNENFDGTIKQFTHALVGAAVLQAPVISLLFIALLFIGAIAEKNEYNPHPFSPQMRYSKPRMEFMNKQMELALSEKLYDFSEVDNFILKTDTCIEELKTQRNKIYNQIRRCNDPEKKENLIAERDALTSKIAMLRDKSKIAKRIIKDRPELEMKIEAEKSLIREWYFPQREQVKNRQYEK